MPTPTSGSGNNRRERAAALRAAQQRAEQRRSRLRWAAIVVAILVVAGVVTGIAVSSSSGKKTPPAAQATGAPMGPEGIALEEGTPLAPITTAATGDTVEGVQCNNTEQVAYHIHTHLAVYVNGALRPISPGIGIVEPQAQQTANGPFYEATKCYYWLHVHAQDGVIHIESPTTTTYTLGQFFAIWGQPLSKTRVGPATGTVTAYVNGKPFSGDPATIHLGSREDVQLDVGTPVPPKPVDWSKSQL